MNRDNSLIEKLKNAQHLVILTGAGISAESAFLFLMGMTKLKYRKLSIPKNSGIKGAFFKIPRRLGAGTNGVDTQYYAPCLTPGHDIIAKLADVLPKVTLMTQNVDDLHERAGSQNVSHLYGSIHKARCIQEFHCRHPYQHPETTDFLEKPEEIEPPKCEKCGDLVRPGVVWFEENLSSKV